MKIKNVFISGFMPWCIPGCRQRVHSASPHPWNLGKAATIAGDRSKQDQILFVKIAKCVGFCIAAGPV